MVIMSAGMHHTVILGLIQNLIHLLDLQRVHICAECYDLARFLSFDHTDYAVSADILMNLVASHRFQILSNLLSGSLLMLGNLRMHMKISSDLR